MRRRIVTRCGIPCSGLRYVDRLRVVNFRASSATSGFPRVRLPGLVVVFRVVGIRRQLSLDVSLRTEDRFGPVGIERVNWDGTTTTPAASSPPAPRNHVRALFGGGLGYDFVLGSRGLLRKR